MGLYLVTGGAGFIGSSIARALIARGDGVRVLDNFSTGKRENLADIADRIDLLEGDIRDDKLLAHATSGVEVVFHEAAHRAVLRSVEYPLETDRTNTHGTLTVLEVARKVGVYTSLGYFFTKFDNVIETPVGRFENEWDASSFNIFVGAMVYPFR